MKILQKILGGYFVLTHTVYLQQLAKLQKDDTTPCPKKKLSRFVLSELRQISTNFDNFWQKDGKRSKYMLGALIFHLT